MFDLKNQERTTTVEKGRNGENRAVEFLLNSGYEVVDRNFRLRGGEIDIIASKGEYLIFVEVKSLPGGTPELFAHEVDLRKQRKIIKTAKCYLQNHREYSNRYIRFDVLALDVPGLDPVYHIVNAFSE